MTGYFEPLAYKRWDKWYCEECLLEEFFQGDTIALAGAKMGRYGHISTINENTVQYEQWPGEIIPAEGINCCNCGDELYPPYPADDYMEVQEQIIDEVCTCSGK